MKLTEICRSDAVLYGFENLKKFVSIKQSEDEFVKIIQYIASQALRVEDLFPEEGIPILEQNKKGEVKYSCEQVRCAIAHGFFHIKMIWEFKDKSNITRTKLQDFSNLNRRSHFIYLEKLKFYFNYFQMCMKSDEKGTVFSEFQL